MPMGFEADALRLRRAIRDPVAVSTIPAVWAGREPRAIAAGLVDVLVNALYLDFAFVRLCDPTGGAAVEIARGSAWQAFPEWLQQYTPALASILKFARAQRRPKRLFQQRHFNARNARGAQHLFR